MIYISFVCNTIINIEVIVLKRDFIITPRDEESVNMSIRIERRIQAGFDKLARESGRSRNELINMALSYALENAKIMMNGEEVEDEEH